MIITEAALNKLFDLRPKKDEMNYLLIRRQGGGCSGMIFKMGFMEPENPEQYTVTPKLKDLSIVTLTEDTEFMNTVTLDFVDSGLEGSGFKFDSTKTKSCCGCKKSFSC